MPSRRSRDRSGSERLALAVVCLVLVVTGTLVTAAGPHAGDPDVVDRLWRLTEAIWVHVRASAVFGLGFLALLVYLWRRRPETDTAAACLGPAPGAPAGADGGRRGTVAKRAALVARARPRGTGGRGLGRHGGTGHADVAASSTEPPRLKTVSDELIAHERPELRSPVLVAAFRGWNDGGQGASLAAGYLAKLWNAQSFAEIDPEGFFDFQVTRPHVSLVEGVTRKIEWPETAFRHAALPGTERDAVLLTGNEPNVRWKAFTKLIVDLAEELDVELVVTLGSLLADVPHTRAAPVTGSASDSELIERLGLEASRYEGPTGIVGVLHDACRVAGLPSASLWAAVPHYVSLTPNPRAAQALCDRLGGLLDVEIDTEELREAGEALRRAGERRGGDGRGDAGLRRGARAAKRHDHRAHGAPLRRRPRRRAHPLPARPRARRRRPPAQLLAERERVARDAAGDPELEQAGPERRQIEQLVEPAAVDRDRADAAAVEQHLHSALPAEDQVDLPGAKPHSQAGLAPGHRALRLDAPAPAVGELVGLERPPGAGTARSRSGATTGLARPAMRS